MKSKHIDGNAVDLMAYCNGGRWELNLYDEIADAMKEGAEAVGVKLRCSSRVLTHIPKSLALVTPIAYLTTPISSFIYAVLA